MGKVSVVTVVREHVCAVFRQDQGSPQIDGTVDAASRSCIKSAEKMLRLFEGLTRTGNLTRFSFTDFQGCSIATIVLLVAGIIEEEGNCKTKACFGLDCLRRMTGGNATAIMGIHFVEEVQAISNEAAARLEAMRARRDPAVAKSGTSEASEYSRWAQWLATAAALEAEDGNQSSQQTTPHDTFDVRQPRGSRGTFTTNSPVSDLVRATSEWEQTAAIQLQQMSTPTYPLSGVGPRALGNMTQDDSLILGAECYPSAYNDDHVYLMGLTGLDVLNFADQLDQAINIPS